MRKQVTLTNLDDLQDEQVYSVSYLIAALELYRLPSSLSSVDRAMRQGLVSKLTTWPSSHRRYSGSEIKRFIRKLINA